MTDRRRAILIVILAVLLLALIVVFVVVVRRRVAPPPSTQTPVTAQTLPLTPEQKAAAAVIQNPLVPVAVNAAPGRTAAVQMAELFAERYGSYSNQGSYQNLRDLLPVMTAAYRAQTEAMLAAAPPATPTFEGLTSIKLSTALRSYDDKAGTATVSVTLQQEKTSGATTVIGTRALLLELKKENSEWKVDAVRWENDLTPIR